MYRSNNLGYTRTAFVSSKKVGNSVERNRSRRLMKESYYNVIDKIKKGYDIRHNKEAFVWFVGLNFDRQTHRLLNVKVEMLV